MSALAQILAAKHVPVRGCDDSPSNFTKLLQERGIPVSFQKEEITESNVVYTGAIHETDERLAAAKRTGKRLWSRADLLGKVASEYPFVLSVAGCHGKTSTTSMLAHIFNANGRAYTSHIGGEDIALGNCSIHGNKYFITEACEFKRSFLSLHSAVAVILNTDRDHTDCYSDENEIFQAYRQFASQAKRTVVNAEERARKIPHALSFGLRAGDIRADRMRSDKERYTFTVRENDMSTVRISLNVTGKYQVQNALAAYAAARLSGFGADEIKRGLESFRGVKRRFEKIGTISGIPVVCDYAHHPSEISAVLESAYKLCDGTVRVVFQPHTYTRTRDLMQEFCSVLSKAESLILYKTYSAREEFSLNGSAVALAARLPDAVYEQSADRLKNRLKTIVKKGDLILVLGAGDIYDVAKSIVE